MLSGGILADPATAETAGFIPVRVVEPPNAQERARSPEPQESSRGGEMIIELAGGHRLRVDRQVDADALRRVVRVLEGT